MLMKIRTAFQQAWKLYRTQLPDMLRYVLLEVMLRLIVLAPLMFLFIKQLRLLALLCVPLFIFVTLPLRQNAALSMQAFLRGERLFDMLLVSCKDYGRKLANGVKNGLLVLLWSLPAIAATAVAVYLYSAEGVQGKNDAVTLLMGVNQLGGGDIMRGLVVLACLYALTFVPMLIGLAFHSGTRHAQALCNTSLLRGHRMGVIGAWIVGLLPFIPFAGVTAGALISYVPKVLNTIMKTFSFDNLPSPVTCIVIVGAAVVVLLLPLLPLRELVQAAYVKGLEDNETKGAAL